MGNEKQFKLNQSVEARFDLKPDLIDKKKLNKAKKKSRKRERSFCLNFQN